MLRNKLFQYFSSLIDGLLDYSPFFQFYFQNPYSLRDDLFILNEQLAFGATRLCIIEDTYPYVVKIDLNNKNVCELENVLYKEAKEHQLEQYFAQVEYIGTYVKTIHFYDFDEIINFFGEYPQSDDDFEDEFNELKCNEEMQDIVIRLPLYAYIRAKSFYNHEPILSNEEAKHAREKYCGPLTEYYLTIALEFIAEYGEKEYFRLSSFLSSYNVNDLHMGNVGLVDDRICIIDYGGYSGNESTNDD